MVKWLKPSYDCWKFRSWGTDFLAANASLNDPTVRVTDGCDIDVGDLVAILHMAENTTGMWMDNLADDMVASKVLG